MVGVPGDTGGFEHHQQIDAIELGLDPLVERRRIGERQGAVAELQECHVVQSQLLPCCGELARSDVGEMAGCAQSARFAAGEAEQVHLRALRDERGQQCTEAEALVVGVSDHDQRAPHRTDDVEQASGKRCCVRESSVRAG